ncbi:hypothetical protein Tco_1213861 [Tanacetum coccineum]
MWEIRIKQYFQIQDYALWEVIENGNSWVPIPVTTPSKTGTSTATKMTVPSTIEEKTCKRNDVKARSLLLMALPNEHQLTFDQIKGLLVDGYSGCGFTPQRSKGKVLRSLPSERDYTMWFVQASTNNINTVNPEVSTTTTKVNTTSTEICTASFSDATMVLDLIGVTWQRKNSSKTWLSWHSQILEVTKWINLCSKNCLKTYEALKKQYDDLLVKLSDTDFKAATYKRGLATLEGQIVKYREHEVLFSEEIALLKRSVGSKEYQMGLLRAELEKVKQEKEGFEFKIAKFDKSAKDLEQLLGSLEEFKEPEVNEYGPRDSSLKPITGCDKESNNSKENTDDSLEQHQMTDTELLF